MNSLKYQIYSGLLLSLTLFSCNYSVGYQDSSFEKTASLQVPFVIGDMDGSLSRELIRQLAADSPFDYVSSCGNYTLNVEMIEMRDQNIGFSYDQNNKGKILKSIIPTETRLSATVKVWLMDNCSGCVVMGPCLIKATTDFDHEYESSRNAINAFSLGQLSDYDDAYDAAIVPLNRNLAKLIVDWMNDGWLIQQP